MIQNNAQDVKDMIGTKKKSFRMDEETLDILQKLEIRIKRIEDKLNMKNYADYSNELE